MAPSDRDDRPLDELQERRAAVGSDGVGMHGHGSLEALPTNRTNELRFRPLDEVVAFADTLTTPEFASTAKMEARD